VVPVDRECHTDLNAVTYTIPNDVAQSCACRHYQHLAEGFALHGLAMLDVGLKKLIIKCRINPSLLVAPPQKRAARFNYAATLRAQEHVRVVGLGFKAEADGRSVSPDSMFIVQELCAGGALRDLVAEQMCSPRQARLPSFFEYGPGILTKPFILSLNITPHPSP